MKVDKNFYKGRLKEKIEDSGFMTEISVRLFIETKKNSEGYARIPQRCLRGGILHLAGPFVKLLDF